MEKYLIIKNSLFTTFGIIVGVSGAISFIQTDWGNYKIDFFFWWSIFSIIFCVVFFLSFVVVF
ncbi:MAG: hypothetical protein Q8Q48_02540, partial [Candidatus Staskawiczbacteria bacterium]|nr:hypothetical protein [Candidatus Staskawiczbacteria bacterium]